MGQALNKLTSVTMREVKSFNIERRAEKVISMEKPTPAPMHPSTVKELARLKEENISTEYLHKKDEQLDNFLKKVYISTPDPAPPLERKINPDRPLPVNRSTVHGISFGYSESEEVVVPEGRVSLKQALSFINNHQTDPKKYSKAAIASQYKISLEDTNDILEYFKLFSVRVEKKDVDPASLSAYERLQLKVRDMTTYNAGSVVEEMKLLFKDTENPAYENNPKDKDVPMKKQEDSFEKEKSEFTTPKKEINANEKEESSKAKRDQLKHEERKKSQENG